MIALEVPLPFGARLTIEIECDDAVAMLAQLEKRASDLEPVLKQMAAIIREDLGHAFEVGGPGWKPLAASTIAAKRMAGVPSLTGKGNVPRRLVQNGSFGAANILIATGALRDSYRRKGARGHIEKIDAKAGTVEVGSSLPIAKYHQKGTNPYEIRAKMAKALCFTGSSGEAILRHAVHHPGLAARPVVLSEEAQKKLGEAVRSWMRGESILLAA
jgi:hypothetical protein